MARKARITAKPSRCIELSKNNKVHATNDKALINRAKQDLRRWQDLVWRSRPFYALAIFWRRQKIASA